jgi:ureidoacrylate peracid hydrolase
MLTLESRLDPEHTALIVVDVQNDFCDPQGACGKGFNANLTHIQAAMPKLRTLIAAAREAGVLVVFIQSVYDRQFLTPAILDQYERRGVSDICLTDTWGYEFYKDFAPIPERGERIVNKHRFNAFTGTDLDQILQDKGITRTVCCGFTTSVCVESTARDAFFRGYFSMIASDAVAEFDQSLHESTLRVFDRTFGPVPTVDEIVDVWSRGRSRSPAARGADEQQRTGARPQADGGRK